MSDNRSWVFDDINKQQAVQLLKCIYIYIFIIGDRV